MEKQSTTLSGDAKDIHEDSKLPTDGNVVKKSKNMSSSLRGSQESRTRSGSSLSDDGEDTAGEDRMKQSPQKKTRHADANYQKLSSLQSDSNSPARTTPAQSPAHSYGRNVQDLSQAALGYHTLTHSLSRSHASYFGNVSSPYSNSAIPQQQQSPYGHNHLMYSMYPGLNYHNFLLQQSQQLSTSPVDSMGFPQAPLPHEGSFGREFLYRGFSYPGANSGLNVPYHQPNADMSHVGSMNVFSNVAAMMGNNSESQYYNYNTYSGISNAENGVPDAGVSNSAPSDTTGRQPVTLYMACDDDSLSEYQCLARKQIELFEAVRDDVESNAQGRNRPIVMGQVGIRCKHCISLPPKHRARGAIYYPAKLQGLYQAAQNMASGHLGEFCQHVPAQVRAELQKLKDRKSSAGGGKKYWADGVKVLGVFEDEDGLRFQKR